MNTKEQKKGHCRGFLVMNVYSKVNGEKLRRLRQTVSSNLSIENLKSFNHVHESFLRTVLRQCSRICLKTYLITTLRHTWAAFYKRTYMYDKVVNIFGIMECSMSYKICIKPLIYFFFISVIIFYIFYSQYIKTFIRF